MHSRAAMLSFVFTFRGARMLPDPFRPRVSARQQRYAATSESPAAPLRRRLLRSIPMLRSLKASAQHVAPDRRWVDNTPFPSGSAA